jgi:hypothetical protein
MHFRDCGPSVTQLHTSRIVCPQPHVFGQSRNGSTLMFRPTRILCKATALSPELLKSHLPQKWFSELARRPRVGMLLSATCKRIRSLTVKKKKGLAISGGVDSMALATLCSGLREPSHKGEAPSFTAFIVDHGLRPGSRDEAVQVANFLDQLSMPSSHLGYLTTKRCTNLTIARNALEDPDSRSRAIRRRACYAESREHRS